MSHSFVISGTKCTLDSDRLKLDRNGDIVLNICLAPIVEGKKIPMGTWEEVSENCFKSSLGSFGNAFVQEQFGKLAFWIETSIKQFENITYLSDGLISGNTWRTFVSDEYERLWDKQLDCSIPISSSYANSSSPDQPLDDPDLGTMVDPQDIPSHWIWNVHVRAFAVSGKSDWLGISVPGPWGIGVTRLKMQNMRLSLGFEVLRPSCTDGKMPVVYFCPGLADGFDVLDTHRLLSDSLGLTDMEPKEHPDWWANPLYEYWDEWERHNFGTKQIDINSRHIIKQIESWLSSVQDSVGYKPINVTLEQYCYRLYGDYRPAEQLGTLEEVREVISKWRDQGVHSGHYFHPFIVNTKTEFYQKHPEAFCKPKDPDFLMQYPLEPWDEDNPRFAPVDWTHPLGREYMLDQVEYMISSAPGCHDCDILKSNNWYSPDPRYYDFHDPDWGIGDMMTYKVQKLAYERAKAVKPHCMVTKYDAIDPYMQPVFDTIQICEDFTATTDFWWRRGEIVTRLLRNRLMWTSAWFCTRTKMSEFYTAMMAWGMWETQAVTHTTYPYYPSWMPMRDKHYLRRKAGLCAYLNSPLEATDICHVHNLENNKVEVYRKKTHGPLAGWYAAIGLSKKSVVTYSETEARVVATESRTVKISLPPNSKLLAVETVPNDGNPSDYEYEITKENQAQIVNLKTIDSATGILYIRIKYTLN